MVERKLNSLAQRGYPASPNPENSSQQQIYYETEATQIETNAKPPSNKSFQISFLSNQQQQNQDQKTPELRNKFDQAINEAYDNPFNTRDRSNCDSKRKSQNRGSLRSQSRIDFEISDDTKSMSMQAPSPLISFRNHVMKQNQLERVQTEQVTKRTYKSGDSINEEAYSERGLNLDVEADADSEAMDGDSGSQTLVLRSLKVESCEFNSSKASLISKSNIQSIVLEKHQNPDLNIMEKQSHLLGGSLHKANYNIGASHSKSHYNDSSKLSYHPRNDEFIDFCKSIEADLCASKGSLQRQFDQKMIKLMNLDSSNGSKQYLSLPQNSSDRVKISDEDEENRDLNRLFYHPKQQRVLKTTQQVFEVESCDQESSDYHKSTALSKIKERMNESSKYYTSENRASQTSSEDIERSETNSKPEIDIQDCLASSTSPHKPHLDSTSKFEAVKIENTTYSPYSGQIYSETYTHHGGEDSDKIFKFFGTERGEKTINSISNTVLHSRSRVAEISPLKFGFESNTKFSKEELRQFRKDLFQGGGGFEGVKKSMEALFRKRSIPQVEVEKRVAGALKEHSHRYLDGKGLRSQVGVSVDLHQSSQDKEAKLGLVDGGSYEFKSRYLIGGGSLDRRCFIKEKDRIRKPPLYLRKYEFEMKKQERAEEGVAVFGQRVATPEKSSSQNPVREKVRIEKRKRIDVWPKELEIGKNRLSSSRLKREIGEPSTNNQKRPPKIEIRNEANERAIFGGGSSHSQQQGIDENKHRKNIVDIPKFKTFAPELNHTTESNQAEYYIVSEKKDHFPRSFEDKTEVKNMSFDKDSFNNGSKEDHLRHKSNQISVDSSPGKKRRRNIEIKFSRLKQIRNYSMPRIRSKRSFVVDTKRNLSVQDVQNDPENEKSDVYQSQGSAFNMSQKTEKKYFPPPKSSSGGSLAGDRVSGMDLQAKILENLISNSKILRSHFSKSDKKVLPTSMRRKPPPRPTRPKMPEKIKSQSTKQQKISVYSKQRTQNNQEGLGDQLGSLVDETPCKYPKNGYVKPKDSQVRSLIQEPVLNNKEHTPEQQRFGGAKKRFIHPKNLKYYNSILLRQNKTFITEGSNLTIIDDKNEEEEVEFNHLNQKYFNKNPILVKSRFNSERADSSPETQDFKIYSSFEPSSLLKSLKSKLKTNQDKMQPKGSPDPHLKTQDFNKSFYKDKPCQVTKTHRYKKSNHVSRLLSKKNLRRSRKRKSSFIFGGHQPSQGDHGEGLSCILKWARSTDGVKKRVLNELKTKKKLGHLVKTQRMKRTSRLSRNKSSILEGIKNSGQCRYNRQKFRKLLYGSLNQGKADVSYFSRSISSRGPTGSEVINPLL